MTLQALSLWYLLYHVEIKVLCLYVYVMIDELNFKSSVTHLGGMSCMFESYLPAP